MRYRTAILLVTVLSTLLQGPMSPGKTASASTQGAIIQVSIFDCGNQSNCVESGYGFRPSNLNLTTNTTIVWTNTGTYEHTTSDMNSTPFWDSGTIQPGHSFSWWFPRPGIFHYWCLIHPFMRATLNVTGPVINSTRPPPINPPPNEPNTGGTGTTTPLPLYLITIAAAIVAVAVVVGIYWRFKHPRIINFEP